MKKLLLLVIAAGMCSDLSAQARGTTVDYQKVNRDAVSYDLPFPEKTVINAIQDTMAKMGYKGRDTKGFIRFSGVRLPELGSGSYDLYFSADRRSKKEKESSTLTMMVSEGDDHFITYLKDPSVIRNMKTYLENISPLITRYDLEQQIAEQEDQLHKEQKKANNLIDDADDLQKKKRKIEQQIEENIKDQARQKTEVEKQTQILEALKAKRGQ